mgnify:FL=1
MGYLRAYLNEMLEKHPQGREFKEVRFLARQIRSYRPDKDVVPIEEADPKETPIGKIIGTISYAFSLGDNDTYKNSNARDKDFKSLKDKLTALIEALDKSEDSQWLATYMIEEGASRCDLALEMFKDYLKWCKT